MILTPEGAVIVSRKENIRWHVERMKVRHYDLDHIERFKGCHGSAAFLHFRVEFVRPMGVTNA